MTDINRLRVQWTGSAIVGPGVSTFYTAATEPSALRAAVLTFFGVAAVNMPTTCGLVIPSSGETLEDSTGEVTGIWTDGTPSTVFGTDPGVYAAGVGARMVWETNGVTNNRRVRGSTFLCPMGAGGYQSDGTLNNTLRTNLQNAGNAFVASLLDGLVIWTRPVDGAGGKIQTVTAAYAPDKVSWLVSRRT